jgi:hypothetical protein
VGSRDNVFTKYGTVSPISYIIPTGHNGVSRSAPPSTAFPFPTDDFAFSGNNDLSLSILRKIFPFNFLFMLFFFPGAPHYLLNIHSRRVSREKGTTGKINKRETKKGMIEDGLSPGGAVRGQVVARLGHPVL